MTRTPQADVYVLTGAPGTGKTSLALALRDTRNAVHLDLARVRDFHLPPGWMGANSIEEIMSVAVLEAMASVYIKHGRTPLVIEDVRDQDAVLMYNTFSAISQTRLVTLVADDDVIKTRLLSRARGYKDYLNAIKINSSIQQRVSSGRSEFETIIDTSKCLPFDLSRI